jgi:hypothetical protein
MMGFIALSDKELMNMKLGDLSAAILKVHPKLGDLKEMERINKLLFNFCDAKNIQTEEILFALIFHVWNISKIVEEHGLPLDARIVGEM